MTSSSTRPRRARRSDAGADRLQRLTEARDRLDAEQAERRKREDAALADYAAAAGEADAVITRRDAALADLDRQRQAVRDDAAAALAALEQRQTTVLAELHALGRRAEDLAALFDLPVKRVRALLRDHRGRAATSGNAAPTAAMATAPVASSPALEPAQPASVAG
jgi:DNA-directed RNA polymerase specialized sigma24 family protein